MSNLNTINTALSVQTKALDELVPYASNARFHSQEQIDQIAASIREFGWTNPILLDGDNGVIAGHARLRAAQKLGLNEAPCIELSHLTDEQKRAYILADNKLTLWGEWDNDTLKVELERLDTDGIDLSLTGFDAGEVSELLGYDDMPDFEPGSEDDQGRLDETEDKSVTCPECGHEFTP